MKHCRGLSLLILLLTAAGAGADCLFEAMNPGRDAGRSGVLTQGSGSISGWSAHLERSEFAGLFQSARSEPAHFGFDDIPHEDGGHWFDADPIVIQSLLAPIHHALFVDDVSGRRCGDSLNDRPEPMAPPQAGTIRPTDWGRLWDRPCSSLDLLWGASWFPSSGSDLNTLQTTSPKTETITVPPPPSADLLCLSGLATLGAWHGLRKARHLHIHIPEWYHAEASQIGHSVQYEIQLQLQPICSIFGLIALQPDPSVMCFHRSDGVDWIRSGQQALAVIAPRGPPAAICTNRQVGNRYEVSSSDMI